MKGEALSTLLKHRNHIHALMTTTESNVGQSAVIVMPKSTAEVK